MNLIDFEYNGEQLSEYGCTIGFVSGSNDSNISLGSSLKLNTVKNMDIDEITDVEYSEVITKTFNIVKNPCGHLDNSYFTEFEVEKIMKWLNRKGYYKFIPIYSDSEYVDVYFYGTFTRIEAILIGGNVAGFSLTFTSNAPYGFTDIENSKFIIGDDKQRKIKTDIYHIVGYIEADCLYWDNKNNEDLSANVGQTINATGSKYEPNYIYRNLSENREEMSPIGILYGFVGDINIVDYVKMENEDQYYLISVAYTTPRDSIYTSGLLYSKYDQDLLYKMAYDDSCASWLCIPQLLSDYKMITPITIYNRYYKEEKGTITDSAKISESNIIGTYNTGEILYYPGYGGMTSITYGELMDESGHLEILDIVSSFPSFYLTIPKYPEAFDDNRNDKLSLYNNSQELGFIYPEEIKIKCLNDGNIYLKNITDDEDRETIIMNCKKNEIITMDCKHKLISSNIEHDKLYNDFNYIYPRLITLYNEDCNTFILDLEEISGIEITFNYASIRKVGVMI